MNGPGHCAECHSPRNGLGGIIASQRFGGGPDLEREGSWVPNITQNGLSDWSQDDIQNFLEDGATPDGDSVSGSMKSVIKNTSELGAADRKAMAVYLKSLPPVEGPERAGEEILNLPASGKGSCMPACAIGAFVAIRAVV